MNSCSDFQQKQVWRVEKISKPKTTEINEVEYLEISWQIELEKWNKNRSLELISVYVNWTLFVTSEAHDIIEAFVQFQ